jgi:ADP-ribosylglycohydrolase
MSTPAVMVGQAIGDALGMPFETLDDAIHPDLAGWGGEFRPGTWHKLPSGHYTDDTEMAMCLAQSLVQCREFSGKNIAARYLTWFKGTPHGMGGSVRKALENIDRGVSWTLSGVSFGEENKVGSGTAMRAAPLGVVFGDSANLTRLLEVCDMDARITHNHDEAVAASVAVALEVHKALEGMPPLQATCDFISKHFPRSRVAEGLDHAERALADKVPWQKFCRMIGNRGNAYQATITALYCAACDPDLFLTPVVNAITLGGDTDTRGAIVGAIQGARCGLEMIEAEYRAVKDFDLLREIDVHLGDLRVSEQ